MVNITVICRYLIARTLLRRSLTFRQFSTNDENDGENNLAKPQDLRIEKKSGTKTETKEESEVRDTLDSDVVDAVEKVADNLHKDTTEKKKVKSKLLQKLLDHEKESYKAASDVPLQENYHIRSLLSGMKMDPLRKRRWAIGRENEFIDKRKTEALEKAKAPFGDESVQEFSSPFASVSTQFRRSRKSSFDKTVLSSAQPQTFDLFNGEDLGIFDKKTFSVDNKNLADHYSPTWRRLEEDRIKLLTKSHGPRNGFEETIEWTEQGRLWPYPINNEYDIGEEEEVGFDEHIFLEPLLDEMEFPTTGPIRHFMQLVCVGLSKNPYMTAPRKTEELAWFKAFFDKEKVDRIDRLHKLEIHTRD